MSQWDESWKTRPLEARRVYTLPACTLTSKTGRTYRFETATILIGSADDNDLVLSSEAVSRYHARLTLTGTGPRLEDLDSTNGTFVDGVRVKEAWLHPRAGLTCGDHNLVFTPETTVVQVQPVAEQSLGQLVGRSEPMRKLFHLIKAVAGTDATMLLHGETGTGKEVVARTVHDFSWRRAGPFVVVDCGALPAGLLESELFGHEKGSFSGAYSGRSGLLESADKGTVFLDEIGEMPLELQPKLLRVLETGEVRRIGANHPCRLDLRVIAATHRNLAEEVAHNHFREDLYYRLNVVPVSIPPLRERREDLPLLISHFLETQPFNDDGHGGRRLSTLPPAWTRLLADYSFPGNVRELVNLVERAVLVPEEIPNLARREEASGDAGAVQNDGKARTEPDKLNQSFKLAKEALVRQFEHRYLTALWTACNGNLSRAARTAQLDRKYLRELLRKYGLYKKV